MKPICTLASILMCIFAVTHSAAGQERRFTNYNCAITVPGDWYLMTNLPPQPGLVAAYGKADKTAFLILIVDDRDNPSGPLDDRFVSEFERGVESTGVGKRISGRFIEIAGIKGYERLGNAVVNGKHASTIMQSVPADGRFYNLQAMRFDGVANEDQEIRNALASFRFLRPPASPVRSYSSGSAAYRMGYLIGKGGGFAIVIGGAIVAIGASIRLRKSRKPSTPPPLPPLR